MIKTKFQRMNKEEKKEAIKKYYETKVGHENKMRFQRLLISGLLLLGYSIYLFIDAYLDKASIWYYIFAATILMFSLIFLIGRVKIRSTKVNDFLTKKKK